jgi:hypothetical protein
VRVYFPAVYPVVQIKAVFCAVYQGIPVPSGCWFPDPENGNSAVQFADMFLDENEQDYCNKGDCAATFTPWPETVAAIKAWQQIDDDHTVMVDVVVNAWYQNDASGPMTSFHAILNPPPGGPGGCAIIDPHTTPNGALLLLLPVLLLVWRRRRALLGLGLLLVLATPALAGSVVVTDPGDLALLEAAAESNQLNWIIPAIQSARSIATPMAEGALMTTGTIMPDGSCDLGTLAIAGSNADGAGLDQIIKAPIAIEVDENCHAYLSYETTTAPDPDGNDSTAIVYEQGGDGFGTVPTAGQPDPPFCHRPYALKIAHYNAAAAGLLPFGMPWLIPVVPTPNWWLYYGRTPSTALRIAWDALDYGPVRGLPFDPPEGGLEWAGDFEVQPTNQYYLSWFAQPGPPGLPAIDPYRYNAIRSEYYLQSIQWFRMEGNLITEYMFVPPSGYDHMMSLTMCLRPEGRVDFVMAFRGSVPNFGGTVADLPRLPYIARILGDWAYEISGYNCPWQRRYPFEGSCGVNCYAYTNYPEEY